MAFPVINPILQFFDNSGNVLSGGLLYTYAPGTTTPKTTYTDENLSVANANPIVLDSAGRCTIFLTDGEEYKFVLQTSAAVTLRTIDEVKSPSALTQANIGAAFYPRTGAEISAGVTPTNANLIYAPYPVYDVSRLGVVGDGITNDAAAIQAAFTMLLAVGGTLVFDSTKTYKCNTGLTLLSNSTTAKSFFLNYNNCRLDFSNLTGVSKAIRYGATSLANVHDIEQITIGPVRLLGPEAQSSPTTHAAMTTTTVGVSLEFCQHWTFYPHEVFSFYKALHTDTSWSNLFLNWHVRNSWIGLHLDKLSTFSTYIGCNFLQCSAGVLAQGADTIACQNFISCRFETNHIHVHLDSDPGAAGGTYPIRNIAFNNCYYEAATYDWFRVGMDYTISADPATRGATNASGYVLNLRVIGGEWANNTLAPATGTAAFCFDSADSLNTRVKAMVFEGPISLTARCRGRPSKSSWKNTVNITHDTDNIESFGIGEFSANLTMTSTTVTLGRSKGNISSVAHVSDGIFDVTFREAYTATAEYTVFGSAANAVVTVANTSATVCRVTVRDFAGVAAFAATVHLFGDGRMA